MLVDCRAHLYNHWELLESLEARNGEAVLDEVFGEVNVPFADVLKMGSLTFSS